MQRIDPRAAAALLLVSGFCALVYQTVWLRELRLVFGASTAASAAVLAIFMAGLGAGSWRIGRRVDAHPNPLALYARLELGIALSAAASPLFLIALRWLYVAVGGTTALGMVGGTALRLVLAGVILGLPTYWMGGTLPAMARAIERRDDQGRRRTGLIYGINTLGAVAGVTVTTFIALEILGLRRSLWLAALLNLLIALWARSLARRGMPAAPADGAAAETPAEGLAGDGSERRVDRFALAAAAAVGFAFLLMELVWYRMLAPILGGSSYTLGLILALALAGIGAGGMLYASGRTDRRPTLLAFAATCALEALFLIVPFALGDRLAVLAIYLRQLGDTGFGGLVLAWTLLALPVVVPAAIVAGYQLPLLIAVVGSGRRGVGREVGLIYAWNTGGAIVGSIAGGFLLIPGLSAPGSWQLATAVLVACSAAAGFVAATRVEAPERVVRQGVVRVLPVAAAAVLLCFARGPTAAWRHNAIGAGRVEPVFDGPNAVRKALAEHRRSLAWEVDGVESSVGVLTHAGNTFYVNGKSDGSARQDAPTQVMCGLVGAALHPQPRRALVVGLGSGSTAGWLARMPGMERVDVVEIEPAIARFAESCQPVNGEAMTLPNLHLQIGDGREVLLGRGERFDVIASEPSNPYRAGIASLFTHDFYRAVSERLEDDGIFAQWLQGYEVDAELVRTVYGTLRSVFPHVESWQIHRSDLLLVASRGPIVHDVDRLRRRVAAEPLRTALTNAWGVSGAEGFYAGFLADAGFATLLADAAGSRINTDDRPVLEFGFARNLGRGGLFSLTELHQLAHGHGHDRPPLRGDLDWDRVRELRTARVVAMEGALENAHLHDLPEANADTDADLWHRVEARSAYLRDDLPATAEHWLAQSRAPLSAIDQQIVGEALAAVGHPRTGEISELLRRRSPVVADAVLARWHAVSGRREAAVEHLVAALVGYRQDPWPHRPLMRRTLQMVQALALDDPPTARRLYDALAVPFSVNLFEEARRRLRFQLARRADFGELCREALAPFEPDVPWEPQFLSHRQHCYLLHGDPRLAAAQRDLDAYLADAPPVLDTGLPTPSPEP